MKIIQKSEKTPRLKAAGVFLVYALLLAGPAGCSKGLNSETASIVETPMNRSRTIEDDNPKRYPEFISGSQTSSGQAIPKQVRDDRKIDSEAIFSSERELDKLSPSAYVRDVPFYPGEEYQCGPSVLASVLNYLGYDIRPEEISKEIYLQNIRGTLNIDMVSFVRRFEEITVNEFQGDIALLKESLALGSPLIVFVDLGIWNIRKGHYMLVVGHDDSIGGFIVYSGADKDKVVRYKDFMRIWKRGGYWALRIVKK